MIRGCMLCVAAAWSTAAWAGPREDALGLEALINHQYAYLDRLPNGRFELTGKLRAEANAVNTRRELVRFAERSLMLLADHHAITGSSLSDSWAVFPSFGDLWIERRPSGFLIEQVRKGSLAEQAGVRPGDLLVAVNGVPIRQAVGNLWADLGTSAGGERDGYAARVLAAGRRDRPRVLGIKRGSAPAQTLTLPNLYGEKAASAPLTTARQGRSFVIKFHDSLGDSATVAAFDKAMAGAPRGAPVILDLSDTPGGGNTSVARGIMGWFVRQPAGYQIHNVPVEERETGVARQWIEQVLPRRGRHHASKPVIRVGRWTGSMGEGMAIGLGAIGACIEGSRMAGLLGAVYDFKLGTSDLTIKLPAERLYAVDGTPRERFVPKAEGHCQTVQR